MIDLAQVRNALPMPELMDKLGLAEHAKPNARCPWHDDKNPSFGIFQKEGRWWFKCHSKCGSGDEVDLIQKVLAISDKGAAIRQYASLAGVSNGSNEKQIKAVTRGEIMSVFPNSKVVTNENKLPPLLVPKIKAELLTGKERGQVSVWRGYRRDFVEELAKQRVLVSYDRHIAFPVKGGYHFRKKDGTWRYSPGAKAELFMLGKIEEGAHVHCFESQWDALAFADSQGETNNIVATRGASNAKLIEKELASHAGTLYLWPQNDKPGQDWAQDIRTLMMFEQIKIVTTSTLWSDLNEWIKDGGATQGDVFNAYLDAKDFPLLVGKPHDNNLGSPKQQGEDSKSVAGGSDAGGVLQDGKANNNAGKAETNPPAQNNFPLGQTLDGIADFLRRYVTFPMEEHALVIALWIAHSWTFKAFAYTPYLHVCSPEKRCGKTRLLECLELLVPKPRPMIRPTEPVLFRTIRKEKPTLLLDEIDTIFSRDADETAEGLRAVLNAGFQSGEKANVPRCVGNAHGVEYFNVFCPKVLAGIGKIPDTVRDRSLDIKLVRQANDEEKAERFRERDAKDQAKPMRAALEAWAKSAEEPLAHARPALPEQLTDRQMDMTEGLLAIADMAGGEWTQKGRNAIIEICAINEDQSTGVRLLASIRRIFSYKSKEKLSTHELLEALIDLEDADAPWPTMWENDVKRGNTRGPAMKLARMLEPFGIKPITLRTDHIERVKGYQLQDFHDSWKRYLSPVKGIETMEFNLGL
jgi:hypothetical protein